MGEACSTNGLTSFAIGSSCKANGDNSVAMGMSCIATEDYSVAMGESCITAKGYSGHNQFVCGANGGIEMDQYMCLSFCYIVDDIYCKF